MPIFHPWCSHYEIIIVVAQGNQIVDLVLLESESLNDMLDLQSKQVNQKYFVVESHYNFFLPHLYLLNPRMKTQVRDYLLSLFI